jgi:hypothetical protein
MEKSQGLTLYSLYLDCYSFDSLRVTSHTLDALASGPKVCAELAVELAQAGPQFTQVCTATLRFEILLRDNGCALACIFLLVSVRHHYGLNTDYFILCAAKMIVESITVVVATLQYGRSVLVICCYSTDRVRAILPAYSKGPAYCLCLFVKMWKAFHLAVEM